MQIYLNVLLRSICFVILIDVSGFSKCNVKEEKYVDNYILVKLIFIENKHQSHLERCLQTMVESKNCKSKLIELLKLEIQNLSMLVKLTLLAIVNC